MADKQQKQYKVIPQEVIDRGELFDIDEWRKQRIAEALKYQAERERGYDTPKSWDVNPNTKDKIYDNCLSTATSAFGKERVVHGNQDFYNRNSHNFYERKGFRELKPDEEHELGDLRTLFWNDRKIPYHTMMLTGFDEQGVPLYTWGPGTPGYIKKNKKYPKNDDIFYDKHLRFVGSPEEIDEINQYNQSILDKQSAEANKRSSKPKPIKVEPVSVERKVPTTQEWLEQMINKHK